MPSIQQLDGDLTENYIDFLIALFHATALGLLTPQRYETELFNLRYLKQKGAFLRVCSHYESIVFIKSRFFSTILHEDYDPNLILKKYNVSEHYCILEYEDILKEYAAFIKDNRRFLWDRQKYQFISLPLEVE